MRARRTGCRARGVRQGLEVLPRYQGLGPPETHWPLENFQKYSVEDFEKDVFQEIVDGLPVDVPEGVVHEGLNTSSRTPALDRFPAS